MHANFLCSPIVMDLFIQCVIMAWVHWPGGSFLRHCLNGQFGGKWHCLRPSLFIYVLEYHKHVQFPRHLFFTVQSKRDTYMRHVFMSLQHRWPCVLQITIWYSNWCPLQFHKATTVWGGNADILDAMVLNVCHIYCIFLYMGLQGTLAYKVFYIKTVVVCIAVYSSTVVLHLFFLCTYVTNVHRNVCCKDQAIYSNIQYSIIIP